MRRRKLSAKVMVAVGATVLAAVLGTGVPGAAAAAPAGGADKQLRAQLDRFVEAWNHGDAAAMGPLFAKDADLINPFGRTASGRDGIVKFFSDELATLTKGTHFEVKEFSPHLMRPDLAVEDMDIEISGGTLAPDPAKPLRNHAFLVVEKQGGHWQVRHLRAWAYLPPPPPPAPPAK